MLYLLREGANPSFQNAGNSVLENQLEHFKGCENCANGWYYEGDFVFFESVDVCEISQSKRIVKK